MREIGTNISLLGGRSHFPCANLCYVFKSSVASTHLSFVILFFRQNTSYPVHFRFDHTTSSVQKNVSICDMGFPCCLDGKESACNAVDPGLIPGLGRSPGEWQPLQYSCLENAMDRGAWQATVHGVAKSQTQLSD